MKNIEIWPGFQEFVFMYKKLPKNNNSIYCQVM